MKQFPTARDTQRDSWSYIEKRRGRREIEVTRRRRGGVKRGESTLASNQCPKRSPQPGTPERFAELHREEKRGKGDRSDLGEKSVESLNHVLTLCDPMDFSPPGSSVHGILQARIPEWVAMPFSRSPSQPRAELTSLKSPALADGILPLAPPGNLLIMCPTTITSLELFTPLYI